MGSTIGRGFLMGGEGPNTVTPIDAGNGEEPGTMEGIGNGGGEAGRQPFWGGRAGKLGYKGGKMAGLTALLHHFVKWQQKMTLSKSA